MFNFENRVRLYPVSRKWVNCVNCRVADRLQDPSTVPSEWPGLIRFA